MAEMKNLIQPKLLHSYCGACGYEVPLEKKYFVKLWQRTAKRTGKVIIHVVYLSYVCPKCGIETSWQYFSKEDIAKAIFQFNLYTDTRPEEKHVTINQWNSEKTCPKHHKLTYTGQSACDKLYECRCGKWIKYCNGGLVKI